MVKNQVFNGDGVSYMTPPPVNDRVKGPFKLCVPCSDQAPFKICSSSFQVQLKSSFDILGAPKQDKTYFQILVMAIGMAIFWLAMINWVLSYSKMSTKIGHSVFWFFFLKFIIPRRYDFAFVHW